MNGFGLYGRTKLFGTKRGRFQKSFALEMTSPSAKQAEEALRESEERYRALFEYNPVDTIVVDNEAKIMMCNLIREKNSGNEA